MRLIAVLSLMIATPVLAQLNSTPGPGDRRLQTIVYSPEQVVQLPVAEGYQLMVSFAAGERIETIAVGDSSGWQVNANKRGDYFFVKSSGTARQTNLTVVTDARAYHFILNPVLNDIGSAAFAVRFVYPDLVASASAASAQVRYRYVVQGAKALRPSKIVEDGVRTVISWPKNVPFPATYRIDDDGGETLANSVIENGNVVLDGVPQKLIFRLDQQTATAVRKPLPKGAR
jgi:type IV secretion system protein VirB9